jgi:hypothetical protein
MLEPKSKLCRNGFLRGDSRPKRLLDCAGVSGAVTPDRTVYRRDAPNPYLTVGPGRHETGRDCGTDCSRAGPPRLVGVDRVPRRRSSIVSLNTVHSFNEFIPRERGSLSSVRARARGNHAILDSSSSRVSGAGVSGGPFRQSRFWGRRREVSLHVAFPIK